MNDVKVCLAAYEANPVKNMACWFTMLGFVWWVPVGIQCHLTRNKVPLADEVHKQSVLLQPPESKSFQPIQWINKGAIGFGIFYLFVFLMTWIIILESLFLMKNVWVCVKSLPPLICLGCMHFIWGNIVHNSTKNNNKHSIHSKIFTSMGVINLAVSIVWQLTWNSY